MIDQYLMDTREREKSAVLETEVSNLWVTSGNEKERETDGESDAYNANDD